MVTTRGIDETNDDSQKQTFIEKGFQFIKSKWSNLKLLLWNPIHKSVLGRDGRSWGLISIYYAGFYTFLFAYFAVIFAIYYAFLNKHLPKYYNLESVLDYTGVNPGLGFRPQMESNLGVIEMDGAAKSDELLKQYRYYAENYLIQNFTGKFNEFKKTDCLTNRTTPLPKGHVCEYNFGMIQNGNENFTCSTSQNGFHVGAPCVIIKLNRIIGWVPRITPDLQIENEFVSFNCTVVRGYDQNISIVEKYYSLGNMNGDINYGKIPFSYFPYFNAFNYVPAFVIVQFKQLPVNTTIDVSCRAFAGNIDHSELSNLASSRGMTRFQLLYKPVQS